MTTRTPTLTPRAARLRARKTQAEVAAETGITLDTIRKVEQRVNRGESVRVARRTWERLCDLYGIDGLAGVEQRT